MKRSILYVSLVIILSSITVLAFRFSQLHPEKTGFNRKIRKQDLQAVANLKLPSTFFYFAGYSEIKLFLKDLKQPGTLFSIDHTVTALKKINLNTSTASIPNAKLTAGVQDTIIYFTDRKTGNFKTISLISGKTKAFKYTPIPLDQINLFSGNAIVGRQISLIHKQASRTLIKIDYTKNKTEQTYTLQKQTDGFFCTDGMLQTDAKSSKLYYMYFYRGEILCLDANLNLAYNLKTIDTISTAKLNNHVKTKTINKQNETTFSLASPPKVVHKNFTLYRNRMYVLSLIKADNEYVSTFKRNQVVDVYDSNKGRYLYSFYIPKYENKKLQEFRIKDDFIYAIFDDLLIKYKLVPN